MATVTEERYNITQLTLYYQSDFQGLTMELSNEDAVRVLKEIELGTNDFILIGTTAIDPALSKRYVSRSNIIRYDTVRTKQTFTAENDLCSVEI